MFQRRPQGIFLLILPFFISLLAFSCQETAPSGDRKDEKPPPLRIGRILPLTGDAASYGRSEEKGTLLAAEEINRAGGINGRKLDIKYEDSSCSPNAGVAAFRKLIDVDRVKAVLGATCSGVTLAIAPVANQRKVVLLSPLSSAAAISQAGPFVFRVMPSDSFQSRILAEWILQDGHRQIAMLRVNNAWGQGVSTEFVRTYVSKGGKIITEETCNEGDRDFRIQLTKIRESSATALFSPTMPKEGGLILKQMKELGISIPVYGADAWSVAELTDEAGSAAEGVRYTYPAVYDGPEYVAFSKAFVSKFSTDPDVNAAGAYDALKILTSVLLKLTKKTNRDPSGDEIRSSLGAISGYKGATGITTFDKNGDSVGKQFARMVIRSGKRTPYRSRNK